MKTRYQKALATRRQRKAEMSYFREVTEPSQRRMHVLLNHLLKGRDIKLRWNPTRDTGLKLMKGAQYGTLIGFIGTTLLRVLPDGYKQPKNYHPAFWEPLIGGKAQ